MSILEARPDMSAIVVEPIAGDDDRTRALERELAQRKEVEAVLRAALAREQAAREDAERSLRFNELFAGTLGHDLRNPLGTITMGASYLARSQESDRTTRTAARIVASAERMSRMVDQLLDLTRLRAGGRLALERSCFDLADLWRQIGHQLATDSPGSTVAVYARGDTTGEWDRDRVAQIAATLVHNALVHGPRDAAVTVVVDGSAPESVAVRVHNDGEVPAALASMLFEPSRAAERRGGHTRGLGLGLYLAQQIAAAHGGAIAVATSAANGTTLSVCLPRRDTVAP